MERKPVKEHTWLLSQLNKSFLLSELNSLIYKRFILALKSYESTKKILLEPNLQMSVALLEIRGVGRNHQGDWVVMTFFSQVTFLFKIPPPPYRFSSVHGFA